MLLSLFSVVELPLFSLQIPTHVSEFKRALFGTELHSEFYTAVKKRTSHHVAVNFEGFPRPYFATIHKFFRVTLGGMRYRLALITSYPHLQTTNMGVAAMNFNHPYATGKIVDVAAIVRKVVFVTVGLQKRVLDVPTHTWY